MKLRAAIIAFLLCLLGLAYYEDAHVKNPVDETMVKSIEENLDRIVSNSKVAMSSNPHDYIKSNQEAYNSIVETGTKGLRYLTSELENSGSKGLKEWIMAKACEDIQKARMLEAASDPD